MTRPTPLADSPLNSPGVLRAAILPAWLVSLLVHLVLLLAISLLSLAPLGRVSQLLLVSVPDERPEESELVTTDFHVAPVDTSVVGSRRMGGLVDQRPGAQILSPEPPAPDLDLDPPPEGQLRVLGPVQALTGSDDLTQLVSLRGEAGVALRGTDGAISRLTDEILRSLEERETLVVWFFDQSASLQSQRQKVAEQFARVYQELGVIQKRGHPAFAANRSRPLLTAVVAFGAEVHFLVDPPTDDLETIRSAVETIERDDTGTERVFTAIHSAASRYRRYRRGLDRRNVMFVVFSDEAGDDVDRLDATVNLCRGLSIPVYVVGVPAPFGKRETLVKWVDPDPDYDQTPQWGRVDQGPETLLPERVRIHFANDNEDTAPLDSGFGPYGLTRLCVQTGGIYFSVHPNRTNDRRVSRREIANYAAYFSHFFDENVMRRYKPSYVSAKDYLREVGALPCRRALVEAAQLSTVTPIERPRVRWVFRDEARFVAELTEAQKDAARLEPALEQMYQILSRGEKSRDREDIPRWQVGFDLAMGRVLASKVRTENYNVMLAMAKQGLKFTDPKNNTWVLVPSDEVSTGSRLIKQAEKARQYLERVVGEHPGTPWALLAEKELRQPLGWKWQERYTELDPPRVARTGGNNNPNPAPPRDDQVRMLRRPPPRRPVPKL